MKQKAFNKEIRRSITHSLGRFIAIFAIVALGVGFYAGLQMTAPDMKLAADAFYDETELYDIRVVSTMGLSEQNVRALSLVEGVEAVQADRETDAEGMLGGEPYAFRIHSIASMVFEKGQPVSKGASNDATDDTANDAVQFDAVEPAINQLMVKEGRLPQAPGECVISADRIMNEPVQLGDTITLTEGTTDLAEVLTRTEFTVVGLASSPYYTSTTDMGSTSVGSGMIEQFMYIPESDFSPDYPISEAFILVEGARELNGSSAAYDAAVAAVMDRVEAIAAEQAQQRRQELQNQAQEELDRARADYERERDEANATLDDAKRQLDQAQTQIKASEGKIASGQREHANGTAQLDQQRADAQGQMADAQGQIDANRATLQQSAATLESTKAQLDAGWAHVAAQGVTKDNAAATVQSLKAQLAQIPESLPQYAQLQAQITQLEKLVEGQAAYDAGKKRYDDGMQQLTQAQAELDQKRASADAQMADAQQKLDAASAELSSGRRQLASGRADYAAGLAEYEQGRADADTEFAQAEADLAQAQADIDAIEMPEWLVMDRSKNYGAESFQMDADRVGNIAAVFPLIFFLVAALVALTTMTRMVDEERMQIGTYKALGYSRSRITSKYLIYAGAASVAGSVAGIAALSFTLPAVIMEAYAIVYVVPTAALQLDWPIALAAAGLGVGITLLATAAACLSTLRESPAALMLPPAPKAGKRILLERIRPLWGRLSFLWKVTCRNIFRYKKRLFMTVVGIAGCTALLLTGFGLQDSINDIIDKHFGALVKYTVVVTEEDDATEADRAQVQRDIREVGHAATSARAHQESMVAVGGGPGATAANPATEDLSVDVVVPEDPDAFAQLWILRNRQSGQTLTLSDEGAVITEKLASENGIAVGDTVVIAEKDAMGNATGTMVSVPVAGIAENYVGHRVFLSPAAYERAFGHAPVFETTFADISNDEGVRDAFTAALQQVAGVKTVAYNDETIDSYKTALKSVNMVVVVLILAAAALAFIVLYNLTNINITERMREIATLKVLGFTRAEVQTYIFRETIILSVLGALVGLVLGIFLENFVVTSAEVNQVMFGRDIHALSFVLAFVLTMAFTVLVMLVMRRKLDTVNLGARLKSNE